MGYLQLEGRVDSLHNSAHTAATCARAQQDLCPDRACCQRDVRNLQHGKPAQAVHTAAAATAADCPVCC